MKKLNTLDKDAWLYHFTYCNNLPFIRQGHAMLSAAQLLDAYGMSEEKSRKRNKPLPLPNGVILHDQRPLHEGNIDFLPGFDMPKLVSLINEHVFFWPEFKESFAKKYWNNWLIRCRLSDLEDNLGNSALFCRYNSGAPRCSNGKKSPRGPGLFEPLTAIPRRKIKEIVFRERVLLPDDCEFLSPDEWQREFLADNW